MIIDYFREYGMILSLTFFTSENAQANRFALYGHSLQAYLLALGL